MRLWSLHPKYLDNKGLVALWREALLAKAVLEGKTVGYTNHPQLIRFRESDHSIECINQYLKHVHDESIERGYNFDRRKIDLFSYSKQLVATDKQIQYEYMHLLSKLKMRNQTEYARLSSQVDIVPHPLFKVVHGEIENWEKL